MKSARFFLTLFYLLFLCLLCKKESGRSIDLLSQFENLRNARITKTERGNTLYAGAPSSFVAYERIPEKAHLEVRYGFDKKSSADSGVRFRIYIQDEKQNRKSVADTVVNRGLFFSPKRTSSISLQPYHDQVVAIEFEAIMDGERKAPEEIYWERASIVSKSVHDQEPDRKITSAIRYSRLPNIIIYLIDALRPDHLEPYGYPKPVSPRIAEFARSGVIFGNAYAQTSWTRASVATIFTGLYPSSHITEARLDTLPDFLPTIPSQLKQKGYHPYGFISQPNISTKFGFGKHFDAYHLLFFEKKDGPLQSNVLYSSIEKILGKGIEAPAFLYIHAVDTHEPYHPDPAFVRTPAVCNPSQPEIVNPAKFPRRSYTSQEMDCAVSLYDAAVFQSDHYFGAFLDLLKKLNLYENSVIILTADHGESFFEHGRWGHGISLHQSEIRIPLIIRFPNDQYSGKHIRSIVRHIDLFPSLLELLNIKIPAGVQGSSFLPFLEGKTKVDLPVFSELRLDRNMARSLILDQYKFIEKLLPRPIRYELYNLSLDPSETINLVQKNPVRLGYMKKVLNDWTKLQGKRKAAMKKPKDATLDPETEELLRTLGYLQ